MSIANSIAKMRHIEKATTFAGRRAVKCFAHFEHQYMLYTFKDGSEALFLFNPTRIVSLDRKGGFYAIDNS